MQKRTNQRHFLLEGLCNTGKSSEEDDQFELRNMDEFLAIEKNVGEIAGIIELNSNTSMSLIMKKK